MPVIASHHAWKDKEHVPSADWPDDCTVQWGASGVVFSGSDVRTTAFFEAFPAGGGFIRGEGATITEAEANALDQHVRSAACEHHWGRRRIMAEGGHVDYLNGGTFCRRCGGFAVTMKPVVILGGWKRAPDEHDLERFIDGTVMMRRPGEKPGDYLRRSFLRVRAAGFAIPDMPEITEPVDMLRAHLHPYVKACQDIIFGKFRETGMPGAAPKDRISGMFSALSMRGLKRGYEEWERGR